MDTHDTPSNKADWQGVLDGQLVRRLTRPARQPGVLDGQIARSIIQRANRTTGGLPLMHDLLSRQRSVDDPRAGQHPIVYAQRRVEPEPPALAVPAGAPPNSRPVVRAASAAQPPAIASHRAVVLTAAAPSASAAPIQRATAPAAAAAPIQRTAASPADALQYTSAAPPQPKQARRAPERTGRRIGPPLPATANYGDQALPNSMAIPAPAAPISPIRSGDGPIQRALATGALPLAHGGAAHTGGDTVPVALAADAAQPHPTVLGRPAARAGNPAMPQPRSLPLVRPGTQLRQRTPPADPPRIAEVVQLNRADRGGQFPLARAHVGSAPGPRPTDGFAPPAIQRFTTSTAYVQPIQRASEPPAAASAAMTAGVGANDDAESTTGDDALVEKVLRKLTRQLAVEGERRGVRQWP